MSALRFGLPAVIRPTRKHTATIIFLHGLGDSGQNLSSIHQSFNLPYVKWVFPTAPNRPITLNGGMSMPGSGSQLNRLVQGEVDQEGIQSSVRYLEGLVEAEVAAGVPLSRIVVGGFSQGGHVASKFIIQAKKPPPACLLLSTWLEPISDSVAPENLMTSFWIGHGTADPVIDAVLATLTEKVLFDKGYKKIIRKMYTGMQHSTCTQELNDVRHFLQLVIPEESVESICSEDFDKMSLSDLKQFLAKKGVSSRGFLEKGEFVAAAKRAL